jgi:flagellar hook-associated protein 3
MRVTAELQSQQAILNIQLAFARMAKLQNQIATGNQVQTASDNPISAVQILQSNTENAQLSTDLTSIQNASSVLQSSVSALTDVQNLLTSVRNIAATAATVTGQTSNQTALASQVNDAIQQMLGIANTQLPDGTYLFGGAANKTTPYAVATTIGSGQPEAITYQGSQQSSQVIVGKSLTVNTLIPGSQVFQANYNGPTIYTGLTGAKPGPGADTATGQGTLQVVHTLTTFGGVSGVQAGASSATLDTVIGPMGANKLSINDISGTGASGTVSLNGGTPVAFNNTDTDLKVTGPSGEVVYLDTTAISAGFNGTETIEGDGTLSVDGGTTTTPIDFSTEQPITDGTTGAVTNVDSSNIRQAGNESLTYPGVTDLFQTLISLRDTINNTQGLSAADRQTALDQQLSEIDRLNASLATPLGAQANQAQFLSQLQTRTAGLQTRLQKTTNDLQSTDMASAIVQLQQQQNLYQIGLQMTANMNQLSLLNFMH